MKFWAGFSVSTWRVRRDIKPRDGTTFGTWQVRFTEWLADLGMGK